MRCIFCKSDSSSSETVEHIIPESLGNMEHILAPGIVCDACNNYLAREVEKPLLATHYFTHARFRNEIVSKKGTVPNIAGIHLGSLTIVSVQREPNGFSIFAQNPKDECRLVKRLETEERGELVVPVPTKAKDYLVSRFLGKVALEVLAQRMVEASVPNGIDEVVDKPELDDLRDFVRRGNSQQNAWRFHERRIYAEDATFFEAGYGHYEVLHEYTLLYVDHGELHLVLALLGVEYAINLGRSEIDGYLRWLEQHANKSPLYP